MSILISTQISNKHQCRLHIMYSDFIGALFLDFQMECDGVPMLVSTQTPNKHQCLYLLRLRKYQYLASTQTPNNNDHLIKWTHNPNRCGQMDSEPESMHYRIIMESFLCMRVCMWVCMYVCVYQNLNTLLWLCIKHTHTYIHAYKHMCIHTWK